MRELDRAVAEIKRRKAQQEIAAEQAADYRAGTRHGERVEAYATVLDVLDGVRSDAPETGARVTGDELVIVEADDTGHRRRTYRATPPEVDADARLTVDRWTADGWVPVGDDYVSQLVVNGRRPFGGRTTLSHTIRGPE